MLEHHIGWITKQIWVQISECKEVYFSTHISQLQISIAHNICVKKLK